MVKPALPYLDVIRAVHERFPDHPLVAYNVSGEYAMLKAAAANGWIDERAAALEVLTGIRRAGADLIISVSCERGGAMADGSVTTEASLVADKGRSKTGETLYSTPAPFRAAACIRRLRGFKRASRLRLMKPGCLPSCTRT